MSFPSVQAYVHDGDFDRETRSHPAIKWLEQYTVAWDAGLQSMGPQIEKWHTPDFTFVKPDGSVHEGLQAGFAAASSVYAPLTTYHHQPKYLVCTETSDGWAMFGSADLFYSLPGQGPSANAKDNAGKTYDGCIPGAFKFTLTKSTNGPEGLQLKRTEVMSDSGPIVVQLLQRGVLKPADLGL